LRRDIHGSPSDTSPLPIFSDNHRALTHITTGVIKARMKHIDVCSHNRRDLHARKIVDCSNIHMTDNVADILTNPLTKEKPMTFTKGMGLL